jgi:hypothetical protein
LGPWRNAKRRPMSSSTMLAAVCNPRLFVWSC